MELRFSQIASTLTGALALAAVPEVASACLSDDLVPGQVFDLSLWKITLPTDDNGDSKPDEIDVRELQDFAHPDFFYINEDGHLVFAAPNKAPTTANSPISRRGCAARTRASAPMIRATTSLSKRGAALINLALSAGSLKRPSRSITYL